MTQWLQSWTQNGQLAILLLPIIIYLLIRVSRTLVKYSEAIMNNSKFGGGFVGGTLVGTITSIPEIVIEITQALEGHPENGLGDDVGSNTFAIFLLALGALFFFRKMFMNNVSKWIRLTFILSLVASIAMSGVLIANRINGYADIPATYVGIIPAIFFGFYIFTFILSYKFGGQGESIHTNFTRRTHPKRAGIMLIIISIILAVLSVALSTIINAFQAGFSIPTDSIGGVFLAVTTSIPEIMAFFLFLRRNEIIAAVSSVTGSLVFNFAIPFIGDLSYASKPSFNNSDMGRYMPLAILTSIMIALPMTHAYLARRFPKQFSKRSIYLIIPAITVLTYVIGWICILLFNN